MLKVGGSGSFWWWGEDDGERYKVGVILKLNKRLGVKKEIEYNIWVQFDSIKCLGAK